MTEQDLRGIVVAQAKGWLGRKEADGSHREIIDVYNSIRPLPRGYKMTYSDPWCAAFVSAVAQATNMTSIIFPECACDPMIALYKAHGRWMEDDAYIPSPGDVIFYDWQDSGAGDNTGGSDHVGLVINVSGHVINIIEGNCGNRVQYTARKINDRYIRGYGLPDYAAAADAGEVIYDDQPGKPAEPSEPDDPAVVPAPGTPRTVALPAPPEGWSYVPLPTLQIGDGGEDSPLEEAVRAAQLLLKGRGFSVGWMGADGDFGRKTESAVGQYQRDRAIERDGIIGPETWRKLICE